MLRATDVKDGDPFMTRRALRWGIALVAIALAFPGAAEAQELPPPPPYPDAPQVTEPLQDAWQAGSDAFVPAADSVLSELGLAAHGAGPALRPGCSAVGSL